MLCYAKLNNDSFLWVVPIKTREGEFAFLQIIVRSSLAFLVVGG